MTDRPLAETTATDNHTPAAATFQQALADIQPEGFQHAFKHSYETLPKPIRQHRKTPKGESHCGFQSHSENRSATILTPLRQPAAK